MDIDELYTVERHETGAEMQLIDQSGNKTDCFIKLAGVDSKLWRKSFGKHRKEIISNARKDKDSVDATADLMASVTLGWRGFTYKGEPVEFSKTKAKQLYKNAPYILEQVDQFIADRANFTKG